MRIRYSLFLGLVLAGVTAQGETYTLTPGQLPSVVRNLPEGLKDVKLSGEVLSQDLLSLKDLPKSVTQLDLSGLNIAESELPPCMLMSSNVRNVQLPSDLKKIGEGSFAESLLEKISLPSGLEKMGPRVFYKCVSLTRADLADASLSELPEECFYGCPLAEGISLPQSLSAIGDKAFMRSGIKEIAIPQVSNIGNYAFAEMPELSGITISANVNVGEGVFFNDPKLSYLSDLPSNLPVLGFAMNGSLTRTMRVDSEIVEEGAFAGLKSAKIVLGKDVREIERHAFSNAENLISVNVTSKGSDVPSLHPEGFSGVDVSKVDLLISPEGASIWRAAEGWKDFNIMEDGSVVEDVVESCGEISIACNGGVISVSSPSGLDYVTIYSLGGVALWEAKDCGESVSAGPFDDKEVVVRAVSGDTIRVGKYSSR